MSCKWSLLFAALLGQASVLAGCQNVSDAPASKYSESPLLAAQVKAGKLPSVDKRLPEKPMVVLADEAGTYGGTWRLGTKGGGDDASFVRIFAYELLLRFSKNFDKIEPNLAETWEVSPDGKVYTIHIRKGIKWSDGEPFTANDIMIWYEMVQDPELKIGIPAWMNINGNPGTLEKVDDYTVKFVFPQPYGLFEQFLASVEARGMTAIPAHWAKKYFPKYADATKLAEAVEAAGFKTWVELWNSRICNTANCAAAHWVASDRPTVYSWAVKEGYVPNATQVVFVRNPYFWKVDQKGQQYPYIDQLVYTVYADVPSMLQKATDGEIDFQMRHFNSVENKPVLTENQDKGGYRFFDLTDAANNKSVIMFNLTHKDLAQRSVYQNKDFRIGMSYAINRRDIIDTVYAGQGKPWQAAPLATSPFYNERLATQYLEYDVAKANEYLDKVMAKKDASGFRLRSDGKPFVMSLEISNAIKAEVDTGNLLVKYWAAVGVKVEAVPEDRALLTTRKGNNEQDATLWQGEGGFNPMLDPRYYLPFSVESNWAEAWQAWYNSRASVIAEEPPVEIKALLTKYDEVKSAVGYKDQAAAMNELLNMVADQFLCVGIMTPPDQYGIAKKNMRNVPDRMILSWPYPTPAPLNTFTFFFAP